MKTLLNTAPFTAAAAEAALLADIVIMNETELEAFAIWRSVIQEPIRRPSSRKFDGRKTRFSW